MVEEIIEMRGALWMGKRLLLLLLLLLRREILAEQAMAAEGIMEGR